MERAGCQRQPDARSEPVYAGYETVCVRHCDGYHFPIAFSASRSQFEEHASLCSARFPEGEASLFVHRTPGEDDEDLVALNGERYTDQSYAFRYRETYDPKCPRPHKMVSPEEEAELREAAERAGQFVTSGRGAFGISVPQPKPVATADPETTMLREGRLSPGDAQPLAASAQSQTSVRMVGPITHYTFPPDRTDGLTKPVSTARGPTGEREDQVVEAGSEQGPEGSAKRKGLRPMSHHGPGIRR